MKRLLLLLCTLGFGILALVSLSLAQEQELPEHPHLLVLGLEFDEDGSFVDFRRCFALAAGRALPLNAQHAHLHFGTAGEKLFENANNVVVPLPPFPEVPFSNCAEFEEFLRFLFP